MTAGGWVAACPLATVMDGTMTMEDVDGTEVVLVSVEGQVYAFDAVCTHAFGYLDQGDLKGHEVHCPLHEGRFDIRTGAVLGGEPTEPVAVYTTKVDNGTIYVRLE